MNFIFLVVKYCIYKTKCDDGTLNIRVFKHVILEHKNIEKYKAICTDNLSEFMKKWQGIKLQAGPKVLLSSTYNNVVFTQ